MFNNKHRTIKNHDDKEKIHTSLQKIFGLLCTKDSTIGDILANMKVENFIDSAYWDGIDEEEDNKKVIEVAVAELFAIQQYLKNTTISTQHGVKGESHNIVVFVAENSMNEPVVHMYRFFELWPQVNIDLKILNEFYYPYVDQLSNLQKAIGQKISEFKKDSFVEHHNVLIETAKSIKEQFSTNLLLVSLCLQKYESFLEKNNVTKAKDCFKETIVYGGVNAYKIFYVGCSRARKNLAIVLDRSKINGDMEQQKNKII